MQASYAQEIEVVSGLYPSGSVKSYDEIKEILLSVLQIQVTKTETYQEEIPFDTVTVSNDMEYTVFRNVWIKLLISMGKRFPAVR